MLALIIYLIGITATLKTLTEIAFSFSVVIGLVLGLMRVVGGLDEDKDGEVILAGFKWSCRIAVVSLATLVLVPSKDTAYAMLAAYGVTEAYEIASESDDVQRIASKSLQLIESTLDKQLTEEQD